MKQKERNLIQMNNFLKKISIICPDLIYLKLLYRYKMKKKLNLKNPKTFNEKLQWLKLYDRKPKYTTMVDKYEVKKYVSSIIGEKYIIPTLDIYNNWEEINFEKLPKQFVIKCTHDSGGIVICKDKSTFNFEEAKIKITKSLKINYFFPTREWPYKNVKPRIIIEKYMQNGNDTELIDYKFFCFDGKPQIMYVSEGLNNHSTAKMGFFDMSFKEINIKRKDYKKFITPPIKPKNLDLMIEIAEKLSKNIPHIRVDFYLINKRIYFGELTFFTNGGFIPFETDEMDYELGKLIKLPHKKKKW